MALPEHFAGFTVLPLSYSPTVSHLLYLRAHTAKPAAAGAGTFPGDRTLFVVNVPPDATARELTQLFAPCGIVERVAFDDRDVWAPGTYGPTEDDTDADTDAGTPDEDPAEADAGRRRKKRKKDAAPPPPPPQVVPLPAADPAPRTLRHTGGAAHVVFLEPAALERALALRRATWARTAEAPRGLAHYAARHAAQRPPLAGVRTHADTYVEVYEHNLARARRRAQFRRGEAVVDEDGFTLVTRGGAYGTTLGGGVGVASKPFMKAAAGGQAEAAGGKRGKKKPKKHEKEGFYKFQRHEEQRKKLEDLKANWKKDQEKVAQLYGSHRSRLKPY